MSDENNMRITPQTPLDFDMLITEPVWGKQEVSKELKSRLLKFYSKTELITDEEGNQTQNPKVIEESLWGLLGSYTRDMRLANLSNKPWNNEVDYVGIYLNLANDLLQAGYYRAFVVAMTRVATKLELSQSKNGFLRKRINTYTQETSHQEVEPPKKSLFGGSKKK